MCLKTPLIWWARLNHHLWKIWMTIIVMLLRIRGASSSPSNTNGATKDHPRTVLMMERRKFCGVWFLIDTMWLKSCTFFFCIVREEKKRDRKLREDNVINSIYNFETLKNHWFQNNTSYCDRFLGESKCSLSYFFLSLNTSLMLITLHILYSYYKQNGWLIQCINVWVN